MAETYEISRLLQVGVEGTPGTLVAATKQLATLKYMSSVQDSAETFTPSGYQAHTVSAFNRSFTTGRITGKPTFGEILYPLAGIFTLPTPATHASGTLSKDWIFDWKGNVLDVPTSFSFENGDSSQVDNIPGNVFTDFGLSWDRGKTDLTAATLGGQLNPAGVLTGSLATPEPVLIPMTGAQVDVYVDNTGAGLGTTKFLRSFDGSFSWTGKYTPAWTVNSALTSYALAAPVEPRTQVQLTLGTDAQGQGMLTALRANTRKFVRVKWTGPIIETTIPYLFQADLAVDITAVGDITVVDGYHCRRITGMIGHDPTWAHAALITITNKMTAL